MRPVDRFVAFLRGQGVDRPPLLEEAPWALTLERWRGEGLAPDQEPPYLRECDPLERTYTDLWMLPRYAERILDEDEHSVTRISDRGIVERELKPLGQGMPLHVRYPVETPADWDALRSRFMPDSGERFPEAWTAKCARWQREGTIVAFQGPRSPSLFGFCRELMGPERVLVALYDEPAMIEDMMEVSTELTIAMLGRTLDEFPVRVLYFWEDMAYNAGPLISPAMFRRLMVPRYRRITTYARSRGVEVILVDSDGNIEKLIPLWLEAGLDGVYPLEVAAGMDVVDLRRRYGERLVIKGGIDKRVLALGQAAIDAELARVMPLVERGRYIPTIDHAVPPDVPYANMCYYWEQKKRLLGIV